MSLLGFSIASWGVSTTWWRTQCQAYFGDIAVCENLIQNLERLFLFHVSAHSPDMDSFKSMCPFTRKRSIINLFAKTEKLGKLSSSLTPLRKHQLRRVKSFLKLETTRVYTDETGAKRCVRAPSPKLTPITDWIWNMCLCVAVLFTLWNPSRVRPVAKIWKLPRCTLVSLACGFIPQHPM